MLSILIGILGIIITILVVVGIHEFGHYLLARLVGVKVLRFSIGFGKVLYRWIGKSGIEYVIAAIPLGGYVKLLDENEETVSPELLPYAFNRQPVYKKFLIVVAGPLFNFIFAFCLYWLLFVIGFTAIIPVIGTVKENSIAAQAGLKPNTEILSIQDETTRTWFSVVMQLIGEVGEQKHIVIKTQPIHSTQQQTNILDLTSWKLNDLKPDPLDSIGIQPFEPTVPAIVGKITNYSNAKGKLKIGDKIIAVNHKKIKDWYSLATLLNENPDETLLFTVQRQNNTHLIPIKVGSERNIFFRKQGVLGISPDFKWPKELLRKIQYNPMEALSFAWKETVDFTYLNGLIFLKLITGKISFASLGGPITIFESAGSALNTGIIPFISFLAFLSIGIGFINILPIPGLDGGHILFQVIETIIGRPIPLRVQMLFYRLGFILLIVLITQALVNDILRL